MISSITLKVSTRGAVDGIGFVAVEVLEMSVVEKAMSAHHRRQELR